MFDTIRKAIIQNREDDALLYEYALTEIENDVILKGLWAKAMALSEGNDNKIQPLYMQYRVQSIKDEFTKLNIAYRELTRDPLFKKLAAIYAEPISAKGSQVIMEEKAVPPKKPMSEMDKFINESRKETSEGSTEANKVKPVRVASDYSADKILKDLGIDSKTKDSLDAKTARLQKELADIKAKKRSNNMPIQINNNPLEYYKKVSDKAADIKNFRLYYKGNTTNLIWYSGHIIYVPKDYFLMKNLVNINHATGRKCTVYKSDVALIDEMKEKNIIFTLADDIEELINRLNASGLNKAMLLSDELGVETTSDVDYSEYNEPIYDEDGSWNIKS